MGRIHVLSEQVANKIAAGEVVERPASVVKELLENALDAGATRIKISVEAGGKKLIQITDNGCGMVRDDAMLAFERHATSKIKDAEDLLSVARWEFRRNATWKIKDGKNWLAVARSDFEARRCLRSRRFHGCGWRHARWSGRERQRRELLSRSMAANWRGWKRQGCQRERRSRYGISSLILQRVKSS